MKNFFNSYGLVLSDKAQEKFEKYYRLLTEYNDKFNITAITEREEVIVKHFIDSAIGGVLISGKTIIDVGSGGGFPAIPLKIMNDDLDLTMVEATGKKAGFLEVLIKELDLKNTRVINKRAEDLAKDGKFREKFDVCTARAVARLNTLSEYCMPFVKVGGVFVAYKGNAKEELAEAESAIKILGGKLKEVKEYKIDGAERTLAVIEKISVTDKKYPRGNGKERKNPL